MTSGAIFAHSPRTIPHSIIASHALFLASASYIIHNNASDSILALLALGLSSGTVLTLRAHYRFCILPGASVPGGTHMARSLYAVTVLSLGASDGQRVLIRAVESSRTLLAVGLAEVGVVEAGWAGDLRCDLGTRAEVTWVA